MIFPEILKELRTSRKLTSDEVAKQLGLSGAAYRNYERGERQPNLEKLCAIADYYCVSTDYLLGRVAEPPKSVIDMINSSNIFNESEKLFILSYLAVDDKQREQMVSMIKRIAKSISESSARPEPDRKIVYFPLMDMPASAGVGIDLDNDEYTSEKAFYDPEADGDFAVQVDGDSMEPDYTDGCFVLIRKYTDGQFPSFGDVALFVCKVDDEYRGFIKQWRDGVLHSLNPEYDDFTSEDIRPIGEVVAVLERV